MASKVRHMRGAWWVVTHANRRRWKKRIGPTAADKRLATDIAKKINAALALGTFDLSKPDETARPADVTLPA